MGDNRLGHGGRNHLFDVVGQAGGSTTNNKVDLFLRSESPRVQQIILHQRLREEIEKNSIGKVRYVDSELYLRNQEQRRRRSPATLASSEVQSATLNIGLPPSSANNNNNNKQQQHSSSRIPIVRDLSKNVSTTNKQDNDQQSSSSSTLGPGGVSAPMEQDLNDQVIVGNVNGHHRPDHDINMELDGDCQVCRIREVREDLMNLNKMIQERNVHFSELKAKCLRNYFKRQVID